MADSGTESKKFLYRFDLPFLAHPVAEPLGNLIGCGNHRLSKFWDPAQLKPLRRPGDTDSGKHLTLVISNRNADAAYTLFVLNVVHRIPPYDNGFEVFHQSPLVGQRIFGEALQTSGSNHAIDLLLAHECHHGLTDL